MRASLAAGRSLGVLDSAGTHIPLTEAQIRAALARPLWPAGRDRGPAADWVKAGQSVCVVVSDHTRATAADRVLPHLLADWRAGGVTPDRITFLVASGIHRPPTATEMTRILGAGVMAEYGDRVVFHDAADERALVEVGRAPDGWPVRINAQAVRADRLVLLGTATFHYHAGFGGGRKSLVPGISAGDLIAHSHSLTLDLEQDRIDPRVEIGRLDGNPVAEYLLACARCCPEAYVINTVLDAAGRLVGLHAGELDLAHRAACAAIAEVDRAWLAEPADLVIASAGSAMNWIQSHKALFNAHRAMKPGGRIVLEAPSPEGLGNERFRHWVTRPTVAEIYAGLRQSPEVLGQTALSTRERGRSAILVTRMPAADAADLGIGTAPTVAAAVAQAVAELPRPFTYVELPHALHVVPFLRA